MTKYLDYEGLQEFKNNLDSVLDDKVDAISGKGLSTNDFTTSLKNKLDNIEEGATANEGTVTAISVDGADYIPINGTVSLPNYPTTLPASDVSSWAKANSKPSYTLDEVSDGTNRKIPTKVSDLTNDSGFITNTNVVTGVKVGNTSYSPSDGVISIPAYPTTLPASDVSDWAKASTKPSYSASEVGLDKVGNFKAVSTEASQGLTSTEQANARANIGAGTSSFSGSYNDLSNKPTIPTAANNGTFSIKTKVGSNSAVTAADFTANQSSADDITLIQGNNITLTTDTTNRTVTIAATDTTYSAATTSAAGLMSATDKSKLDGIASGATANTGTITGIKMNGASKGTSGVVDLGTIITAHQDISGKVNTSTTVNGHALTGNVTVTKSDVGLSNVTNDSLVKRSEMGAASGVATLDSSGKVPSSQLPSYVDDVIEAYYKSADGKFYTTLSSGTYSGAITGETGKIYVDLSTNRTYRWGGSAYAEIKASPGTLDDITDGSTYVRMTSAERTKLSGIATGATANTGTITKVGNTSSGAVTVSSSNNTASFGSAVTVGSIGGIDLKFTMPGNPNTNTWRPIQVGGTDKLTDSSTKLNFAGSGATSVSYSNGTITISSTDNNTVTSINGKTGAIAAADIATVLTGAGYKLTDTNTWKAATTSQEGYVPTLALSGTSSGAKKDIINTQASDYVLTYTSGTETAPVWRKLPANAYANSTYTVNNGTFTVKGAGTAVSSTSANASGNTAVDFVAGSNVTITPDATNGKITISSTDTNTWRPVSDSVSSTSSTDAASSKAVKTAYDLAASKTSNTGTVTKITAGTGLTGGDITTTGTIALATSGVTAGTYKRVTVDAYGRVTSGDNTDSDTKNTAGTTNKTGTKMFLAAATEQSANPVTYSNSNCYIGTDNCLYSGGNKVLTSYTNTTYAAGTGVTISGSNNAINVTYGTTANTACQGNDSRLSNARPASDVSAWAKAASKPSYGYSEIGYTVNAITSAGGTLSLDGTVPLHVVTLTGNVSALLLSTNPPAGHSCHVILTASSEYTVAIAHDSTNRVCPNGEDPNPFTISAGGYVEIDFLNVNNKIYVRGI